MSVFSETMIRAISDYRTLLRRHLSQVDRMLKLKKLNLKNDDLYRNDMRLYQAGLLIIEDMEANSSGPLRSYYSYSGVTQFCEYLKEYLSNYYVEKNQVIHRAQKASRAQLSAIQLMSLPAERLNNTISQQLFDCNQMIVTYGSQEQCELHLQTLERSQVDNPGFYTSLIAHLESLMTGRCSQAA